MRAALRNRLLGVAVAGLYAALAPQCHDGEYLLGTRCADDSECGPYTCVLGINAPADALGYCGEAQRDPVAVSGAAGHTCALLIDGELACWGDDDNANGRLGAGSPLAGPVQLTTRIDDAIDVETGLHHSCALRRAGGVFCWGDNELGQRGVGVESGEEARPAPDATVTGLSDALALRVGDNHSCAVTGDGTVVCWGDNKYGQLGDGSFEADLEEVGARDPATVEPSISAGPVGVVSLPLMTHLAAGAAHSCSLRRARFSLDEEERDTGEPAPNDKEIWTVAELDLSARVYCWGANDRAQLGGLEGLPERSSTPVVVYERTDAEETSPAEVLQHAVALASGAAHTCALIQVSTGVAVQGAAEEFAADDDRLFERSVACWGAGDRGQLGDGAATDSALPVTVAGLGEVAQISAGAEHSCALQTTGEVMCWGANDRGQLGDGATEDRPTAVQVASLAAATHVGAGARHTCAVQDNLRVLCWGDGEHGQLGDAVTSSATPLLVNAFAPET